MEFVKQRRSIRKYTDRDIAPELLNELLEASCRASTMGNLQLYSVIVTRDEARKKAIAPLHFNQPMVTQAPVVLTFCADLRRTSRWCEERKTQPGYDNFLSFLNGATDALLAAQTFATLAEEKGLGLCYLGTTLYTADALVDALQLPKLVVPVTTITVGYPDEQPAQTDRLPLEAIVHDEVYKDYTREDIDRLYAYKESLPENEFFVRENHKETLAQVFAEVRYTKKDNEAFSESYIQCLKRQGLF